MENPFPYSDTNKRYHTYTYAMARRFSCKTAKIPLDAGMTCPNIDGTKGKGGCTYCSGRGSGDFAGLPSQSLLQQFQEGCARMEQKWQNRKFIAYFQAHTNTYAPLSVLKDKLEQVLSFPDVVGIAIATRADCISEEIADYLQALSKKTYLEVELGLQTIHDETAQRINRCHSYADFLVGFNRLKVRGINVCVHVINGLPGETYSMMMDTAKALAQLDIQSIKIHLLHVMKHTRIADELQRGDFELMQQRDYVNTVCDQLEILPPEIVIQRLTGDSPPDLLIGPTWSLAKRQVLNDIDKEFVRRDSYQGIYYQKLV